LFFIFSSILFCFIVVSFSSGFWFFYSSLILLFYFYLMILIYIYYLRHAFIQCCASFPLLKWEYMYAMTAAIKNMDSAVTWPRYFCQEFHRIENSMDLKWKKQRHLLKNGSSELSVL
jgi:hypothetical protein